MLTLVVFCTVWSVAVTSGMLPVVVLDNGVLDNVTRSQREPLRVTGREDFENLIRRAEQMSSTILFIFEEALSYEDFTSGDMNGEAFTHIKDSIRRNRAKIYFNVFSPYECISKMFQQKQENTIYLDRNDTLKILKPTEQKYFFVYFNRTENEPQITVLRQHENAIMEMLNLNDLQRGPIIAVYTGMLNPIQLKKPVEEQPILRTSNEGKLDKNGSLPKMLPRSEYYYHFKCGFLELSFQDPIFIHKSDGSYLRTRPHMECKYEHSKTIDFNIMYIRFPFGKEGIKDLFNYVIRNTRYKQDPCNHIVADIYLGIAGAPIKPVSGPQPNIVNLNLESDYNGNYREVRLHEYKINCYVEGDPDERQCTYSA